MMDTTNLATYFVQRTSDNALLGRDDIWYPPAACRRILFKLCRFDRDSAARKAKSCQYAAKPIEEKDARACLGFKSPSWNKFWATNIKTIKVCVFTTENALEAENNRHPEPGPAEEAVKPEKAARPRPEYESSIGRFVHADPAILAESFDTPLIRETMEVISRLSALSLEWSALTCDFTSRIWKIENALNDESHFAEFMNLNSDEGNRCYQRMHQLRIARRQLKNERNLVGIINEALQNPAFNFAALHDRLEWIRAAFEKSQDRTYVVRERWPFEDDRINA